MLEILGLNGGVHLVRTGFRGGTVENGPVIEAVRRRRNTNVLIFNSDSGLIRTRPQDGRRKARSNATCSCWLPAPQPNRVTRHSLSRRPVVVVTIPPDPGVDTLADEAADS